MKLFLRFLPAYLSLALAATAFAEPKLKVSYDKKTDFSKYKTYKWGKVVVVSPDDKSLAAKITQQIEGDLLVRGWTLTTGDPDAVIDQDLKQERVDASYESNSSLGAMGMGDPHGGNNVRSGAYLDGQAWVLNVQVLDAKNQSLLWKATLTTPIEGKQESAEKLEIKEVKRIFSKFPPK